MIALEMNDLIELTEKLLQSIAMQDWPTYESLCDPSLSAFEPEACGHLIEGMEFHRFYFELDSVSKPHQITLVQPHLRMLGEDVGIVSYNRLLQGIDANGAPVSQCFEETRVWQRQEKGWQHVHFHRSTASPG